MAEYEKLVRVELTAHGCTFVRHGKGDHDIWYSPFSSHHASILYPFPVTVSKLFLFVYSLRLPTAKNAVGSHAIQEREGRVVIFTTLSRYRIQK